MEQICTEMCFLSRSKQKKVFLPSNVLIPDRNIFFVVAREKMDNIFR